MKKILALWVTAAMAWLCMLLPVSAADKPEIAVTDMRITGGTVTCALVISGNVDISSLQFSLSYNRDVLGTPYMQLTENFFTQYTASGQIYTMFREENGAVDSAYFAEVTFPIQAQYQGILTQKDLSIYVLLREYSQSGIAALPPATDTDPPVTDTDPPAIEIDPPVEEYLPGDSTETKPADPEPETDYLTRYASEDGSGYWVQQADSTWIFEVEDGSAGGWQKIDGSWYYFAEDDGVMQTGWIKDGDTWYYLRGDGSMKTGWLRDGDTWYYLRGDGSMKTGWLELDGVWYYLSGDGSMKTGWVEYQGKWYYLDPETGEMLTDTVTPDGYYVNADGVWVE